MFLLLFIILIFVCLITSIVKNILISWLFFRRSNIDIEINIPKSDEKNNQKTKLMENK